MAFCWTRMGLKEEMYERRQAEEGMDGTAVYLKGV